MIRTGLLSTGIFLLVLNQAWSQTDSTVQANGLMATGRPDGTTEQTAAAPNQAADKLFELPPLKNGAASLIGGSLESIDRVRDRMVIRLFGRGEMRIAFDPRTQFLRGTATARAQDMRPGDRIYVETVLNGTAIFAKAVHLPEVVAQGAVQGQVIDYDATRGTLSISDQLSTEAVQFR